MARLLLVLLLMIPVAATEVIPAVLRIQPEPGQILHRSVRLSPGATLLAVDGSCPCIQCLSPLPHATDAPVELALSGAMPGVKTLQLHTTAGIATLTVLVAIDGAADGLGVIDHLQAQHPGAAVWLIVDQPQEKPRNCGCSAGSLGGLDRLAGLPAVVRSVGLRPTAVITGTVGPTTADHLRRHGWHIGHSQVPIWDGSPTTPWLDDGVIAVIARQSAPQHRRIVHPIADGLLAEALVTDDQGAIVATYRIPIDRSLPAGPGPTIAAAPVVPDGHAPSQSCAACHPAETAAWKASRHAHAWDSLAPADRTTECAACHVTPTGPATVSSHVHCQACHQGADAHAARPAVQRTTGLKDCRSCHDTAHHPEFDPLGAWLKIQHGKAVGAEKR